MAGHDMHSYPHPPPPHLHQDQQQHQQQQWAPPPPPIHHHHRPMMGTSAEEGGEVRTIFIAGLPEDVKERELTNLLRWLPGFEASQVNFKGPLPMGFALFSAPHHAIAARDALQGMEFDKEKRLHTQMAKKNLYLKRGILTNSSSPDPSKRLRKGDDYAHTGYPAPPFPPGPPPPGPVWGPPGYIAPPPPPYDPYGGYPLPQVAMPPPAPVGAPAGYAIIQNSKDNPPCNTLFIGNLGDDVNEAELQSFFVTQPGYKQMKVLRKERDTVCFIEFNDVSSAVAIHQSLQGAILPSTGRAMRIQFSKNPFGRRKDSTNGNAFESK